MNAILVFLAAIWPLLLGWVVLRLFPGSVTKFVEKEIERRSDAKLERVKAELHGSYSTLKTSVDLLAVSNSAMNPQIIKAVSALWSNMMEMRKELSAIIVFDRVILSTEAEEAFSRDRRDRMLDFVRRFENNDKVTELLAKFSNIEMDQS